MTGVTDYRVRISARAKRVRVQVTARDGVVVIVPKGFARSRIPTLLRSMQDWIERAVERVNRPAQPCLPQPVDLPEEIALRAIGEVWAVRTQPAAGAWVKALEQGAGVLLVTGKLDHIPACLSVLHLWLNQKSHRHLVPWLHRTSEEQRLPFGRATVRSQRTRWGSCSGHKTISINQKLLFLPCDVVRYVFIHELCHTVHLNHSREFWSLVGDREPDYARLRAELRKASQWVPAWIEPGRNLETYSPG